MRRCALLDDLYEFPKFRRWLAVNGGYRAAAHSAVQTHHIWGGKTRLNRKSNLLPLCLLVHHYIHNVETLGGRIACVWKRSSLPDFSWEDLNACAGLNVRGWLESKLETAGEFRWMIEEVLSKDDSDARTDTEAGRSDSRRRRAGKGRLDQSGPG